MGCAGRFESAALLGGTSEQQGVGSESEPQVRRPGGGRVGGQVSCLHLPVHLEDRLAPPRAMAI